MRRSVLVVLVAAGLGCAAERAPAPSPPVTPAPRASAAVVEHAGPAPVIVGGDRPVTVHVPAGYREGTPAPLVMMLHAFGVTGALEEWFFRLKPHADARGFVYVAPDGTIGPDGRRFWNAVDVGLSPVDDVAYLRSVIDDITKRFTIDDKRVFLVGHSNGAMMAHRLACELPERFAAVASVAGTLASPCTSKTPVAVLEIHGTDDATVRYDGGVFFGHAYPGAKATAERWAAIDGCAPSPSTSSAVLDLDLDVDGAETTILRWSQACRPGGWVELWTVRGGVHVPTPTSALRQGIVEFLFAHPRP